MTLWSPAGARDGDPLRLLAVHDGPEYAAQARLTALAQALIDSGRVPAHRIALLHAGPREEWYSASALPACPGRRSAWARASARSPWLHAQRRHPEAFAGLFLQSASFFMPRFDHMEKGFRRYARIVRFVRGVIRAEAFAHPVAVTLTCGADEDNIHNNRRVAAALALQGYRATLREQPGGHDYAAWRRALRPHLAELLAAAWATP